MSEQIDDRIHRIAGDIVEVHKKDVAQDLAKLEDESRDTLKSLNAQDKVLVEVKTKLDAIYGNGSGKKGILDDIKEEQGKVKLRLETETTRLNDKFDTAEDKQASFRHEVRGMFETLQLTKTLEAKAVTAQKEETKATKDWIKWVAGGVSFLIWEAIKIYFLKVKP